MEVLNAELQLQAGEFNVTKGLVALNMAQDYFETVAAQRPKGYGSTTGTVVTAASTESTTYPAGLLRLDRLQLLASNSRPKWQLKPLKAAGGHASVGSWPLDVLLSDSTGEPTHYWTNGTAIYWHPLPAGISTVRWYGFQRATNITAAGTFAWDDGVALPIAAFACRLIKTGLDDDAAALMQLATDTFNPILDTLSSFQRDGASSLEYTETHTT